LNVVVVLFELILIRRWLSVTLSISLIVLFVLRLLLVLVVGCVLLAVVISSDLLRGVDYYATA
jgi:hypothetical protein